MKYDLVLDGLKIRLGDHDDIEAAERAARLVLEPMLIEGGHHELEYTVLGENGKGHPGKIERSKRSGMRVSFPDIRLAHGSPPPPTPGSE
jgi:hypothetical protein